MNKMPKKLEKICREINGDLCYALSAISLVAGLYFSGKEINNIDLGGIPALLGVLTTTIFLGFGYEIKNYYRKLR